MSESETPRTDAQRRLATSFDQTGLVGMAAHAEELERELAAAKAEVKALRTALTLYMNAGAGNSTDYELQRAAYYAARAALAKEKS